MDPEQTKKFNRQIRHIATMVPASPTDDTYAFVCECGCEETVRLSAADFDRKGGAWATGHKSE
jgi:hypothetical protein